MRKTVVAIAALAAICVGVVGGPARAEGQDWNAVLTPPMMERIESVLSMDGKATADQFSARAQAFAWWLAGNVERLKGNPAQTLEAGLAALAATPEIVLAGGSGGNMPPCVAQHQSAIKNCSYTQGGYARQVCLRSALLDYIRCIQFQACYNIEIGSGAAVELRGCLGSSVKGCKTTVTYQYTIPVRNGRFAFSLRVYNNPDTYNPYQKIRVTVKYKGNDIVDSGDLGDDERFETYYQAEVPGMPDMANGVDLRSVGISVTVDLDKDGDGINDYLWVYTIQCQ